MRHSSTFKERFYATQNINDVLPSSDGGVEVDSNDNAGGSDGGVANSRLSKIFVSRNEVT